MISQTLLDQVVQTIEQGQLDDALVAELRAAHAGTHFTLCMEDDMNANAKPVVERPGFNIYLVDSSDHCSCLTNDLDSASGMVIAEVIDED